MSWLTDKQILTLEEVPNTDRLKAGFFRLDWEGWGPVLVLSVSGDQSWGNDAVLEVGTSVEERFYRTFLESTNTEKRTATSFISATLLSFSRCCSGTRFTNNSLKLKSVASFCFVADFAVFMLLLRLRQCKETNQTIPQEIRVGFCPFCDFKHLNH